MKTSESNSQPNARPVRFLIGGLLSLVIGLANSYSLAENVPAQVGSNTQETLNNAAAVTKLEAVWLPRTKKGKPEERADALYQLGNACFEAHQLEPAEKYLREALLVEETLKRPENHVGNEVALAIVLAKRSQRDQAKKQYEEALELAEKNNLKDYIQVITDSLGTMCDQAGQLDEAEKWHKKAFDLAVRNNSIPTQISSLINQAIIQRKRGNKERALKLLTDAVDLTKKTGSGLDVGNALVSLGRLQHDLGMVPQAIEMQRKAMEIFHEELENVEEAQACQNIGESYYEIHDIASARKSYLRGIELLKDENASRLYVSLLIGLGSTESDLGEFTAAEQHHKLAVELAKKLNDRDLELNAQLGLGNDDLLKGDPESGLHQLLDGEKILSSSNLSPVSRGGYLIGIGRCYKVVGQMEAALKYYGEALRLFKDLDDKSSQAQVLTTIAVLHFDNKNPTEAESCYKEARKIYESMDDKRNVAILDYNEAQLLLTQSKYSEAAALYSSALANLKNTGDKYTEGMVLRGMGLSEYLQNHPQKALAYYQDALKSADLSGSVEAQWDANIGLGKCYKRLGLNDLALTHLTKATELVEKERGQLSRDSFKTYNLDFRNDCFIELLDLYVRLNRPYEALEVAEKGRARAFLDMLSSRKAGKLGIETFKSPLSSRPEPAAVPGDKALNTVQVAKAEPGSRGLAVVPRASQVYATTALSPVNASAPTIEEIKKLVQQSKSTVVEYYLLPDRIIAWVIDPDTTIHMVPPIPIEREKLKTRIEETYRTITSSAKDKVELEALGKKREAILQELYMSVFAPIESYLPKNPDGVVTIIPHGPMFSIPFAALMSPDGKYLIEKHTLAYTPAIGVWRATQKLAEAASQEPNKLLAFGNPITEAIAFLGKLPYSEKEVQNIANLFGKDHSVVKIGQEANKKAFADLAPQFTDVHLATHGLVDEEHPMESSLVLAPTAYDDGMLSVKDIISMKELKARLVVLSACQTGRGKITGDGVVGLSRAFIIAGTPSVMVSQWNVDDIMTEFQMKQFYKSYLAGVGKSKSLREAQLATIKFMEGGGKVTVRANPRYWAAFQLIGQSI